jgi:hypothetical protein
VADASQRNQGVFKMTSYSDQLKAYRNRATKHGVKWPTDGAFALAAKYIRAGTDRHVAAAMMIGSSVTMEAVELVTGAPQYNVVTALKAAGCKQISGTDKDGYRLYAFTAPKAKKFNGKAKARLCCELAHFPQLRGPASAGLFIPRSLYS